MYIESSRTGSNQEHCNMHKIVVAMLHFVLRNLIYLNSSLLHPFDFIRGFGYKMRQNIYFNKMRLIKCIKFYTYVVRDAALWIILKPQLCAINLISCMNFAIPISCAVS